MGPSESSPFGYTSAFSTNHNTLAKHITWPQLPGWLIILMAVNDSVLLLLPPDTRPHGMSQWWYYRHLVGGLGSLEYLLCFPVQHQVLMGTMVSVNSNSYRYTFFYVFMPAFILCLLQWLRQLQFDFRWLISISRIRKTSIPSESYPSFNPTWSKNTIFSVNYSLPLYIFSFITVSVANIYSL